MMTEINLNFEKPIDFLTYQLGIQFPTLSNNELKLVALLHLKGLSTEIKKYIVTKGIFKSAQSVENQITKLRKLNILEKNTIKLKYPVSRDYQTVIKINLTLDASKGDQ